MAFDHNAIKSDGGAFLKMADKEMRELLVVGGPTVRKLVWSGGRAFDQGTPEYNDLVAKGETPSTRFQIEVVDMASRERLAWEVGKRVVTSVSDVLKESEPKQTTLKVRRTGTGKDTTYAVMPGRIVDEKEVQQLTQNAADPF